MEEILQVVVELFLQLILEVVVDLGWRCVPEPARVVVKLLLLVAVAGLLGWFSTFFAPFSFIRSDVLRLVYIGVVPILIGIVMSIVGRYFAGRDMRRGVLERFGYGWAFAFAFASARYLALG